jgi:SET domain-containing protein
MLSANPNDTPQATPPSKPPKQAYRVHRSKVHGRGVFAQRDIEPGERIIQYRGREITWDMALERAAASGAPHNHTFFFSLSNGNVVDGGDHGNVARYINHSCEPNCEAIEEEDGRIFIYAMHAIVSGDELNYSYPLVYDGRHTAAVKRAFACHCGTAGCSGTMLAPKPRTRRKPAKVEKPETMPANAADPADPILLPSLPVESVTNPVLQYA